jgi:hypothetical protein
MVGRSHVHILAKLTESVIYKLFLYSFDSVDMMSDIKGLPDGVGVLEFRGNIQNLQRMRISKFLLQAFYKAKHSGTFVDDRIQWALPAWVRIPSSSPIEMIR